MELNNTITRGPLGLVKAEDRGNMLNVTRLVQCNKECVGPSSVTTTGPQRGYRLSAVFTRGNEQNVLFTQHQNTKKAHDLRSKNA